MICLSLWVKCILSLVTFCILRAYTYIKMLGKEGLFETSQGAIINANYLKALIKDYFDFPYDGQSMHEFVMSGDRQKRKGVSTMEIANDCWTMVTMLQLFIFL